MTQATKDVKEDFDPKTLHTKAIRLDAAEKSASDRLAKIREQKEACRAKAKANTKGKSFEKGYGKGYVI